MQNRLSKMANSWDRVSITTVVLLCSIICCTCEEFGNPTNTEAIEGTCDSAADLEWENTLNELNDAVGDLQDLFGNDDGTCQYKCKNGKTPKKNKLHKKTYNGCGTEALGVELDTSQLPAFTKCCNIHDLCYDECNADKDGCDNNFSNCLEHACKDISPIQEEEEEDEEELEKHESCRMISNLMSMGVSKLGCKAFRDSQKKACYCDN